MSLRQQADRIRYVPQMLVPALAGKTYAHHQAAYTAALRRLYEAFHDVGHAGIIVDSSKDVSTLYLLTQMADVRLRLLHLVRDSRAVAYSWMKRIVRPDIVGREEYMPTFSPGKACLLYTSCLLDPRPDERATRSGVGPLPRVGRTVVRAAPASPYGLSRQERGDSGQRPT